MKKELELYLHIPFCVSKCKYCDFLSAPSGEEQRQIYVERLCRRIRYWSDVIHNYGYEIVSIFVGGGTPSILTEAQITQVFEAVYESFPIREDAEITLEMNPGTDVKDKLPVYRKLGINRLSMGLQSADNKELKCLGRIHTYEDFRQVYQWAREAGFTNVNVDLMSAIPGQTLESYVDTLRKVADLEPEHISAYSLIIEEGTPFCERKADTQKNCQMRIQNGRCMCAPERFWKTMVITAMRSLIMRKMVMNAGTIWVTGTEKNIWDSAQVHRH